MAYKDVQMIVIKPLLWKAFYWCDYNCMLFINIPLVCLILDLKSELASYMY